MNSLESYVGQTLDEKYRLERLLGQGGMGAVYLATHLGTERYVALKLITPQFMRNEEFVERFKREARAAGRLRHPNVVDVTDFGFARAGKESVAYLVMEYLDGCTLSDVLAEEKRLPLYWVVDILEQVCSAVHEAHQQGIVHRDLKPDNIWLEPNGLGGYRVKVLDFGIAKLGDVENPLGTAAPEPPLSKNDDDTPTIHFSDSPATVAAASAPVKPTRAPLAPLTNLESETLVQPHQLRAMTAAATQLVEVTGRATQLMDHEAGATHAGDDSDQTRLLGGAAPHTVRAEGAQPGATNAASTAATTGLTRVGAILGTPLYMSPEQCRGENLDARSDIYSLGIIAYQMLAGAPPFTGETTSVIRAHTESQPTPLREHDAKLPKRVSRLIMSALEKEPAARPQTAIAFANAMRANADGLGALYRRAFALYSEYFPKFLKLSLLAHIPTIIVTVMLIGLRLAEPRIGKVTTIVLAVPITLLQVAAAFLTPSIISGVTAIIVTQLAVAPLKPVSLRAGFRSFAKTLAAIPEYRHPYHPAYSARLLLIHHPWDRDDDPLFAVGPSGLNGGTGKEGSAAARACTGLALVAHNHPGHVISVSGAGNRGCRGRSVRRQREQGPWHTRQGIPAPDVAGEYLCPAANVYCARSVVFEDAAVWRRDVE